MRIGGMRRIIGGLAGRFAASGAVAGKRLGLAALGGVLLPICALAAEPAGEARGGMPQLRFNEPIIVGQVVWLLIIFGLLYYIMSRYALPGVAAVLEDRRTRIAADLAAARTARDAGNNALAEHRAATAAARAEAQAGINAALQQAQDAAAAKAEVLNAQLAAQIEAADARIAVARDAAMGALRQVVTETAEALVQRLVGSADRAAIDAAVGLELSARGHA
jgi:F-type H+-transporting ATPase subunit b